jgi:hypothetical protein
LISCQGRGQPTHRFIDQDAFTIGSPFTQPSVSSSHAILSTNLLPVRQSIVLFSSFVHFFMASQWKCPLCILIAGGSKSLSRLVGRESNWKPAGRYANNLATQHPSYRHKTYEMNNFFVEESLRQICVVFCRCVDGFQVFFHESVSPGP